jgi:hypothetical protein
MTMIKTIMILTEYQRARSEMGDKLVQSQREGTPFLARSVLPSTNWGVISSIECTITFSGVILYAQIHIACFNIPLIEERCYRIAHGHEWMVLHKEHDREHERSLD